MKAIIMAGGAGTRLRPVSQNLPKPMVPLFDRPTLAHTLTLLKRNNIHEACLTLRHLPQAITNHFGDGADFGIRLVHQIEETPLGTAGSVAACRDFIGDEPVIILSGDAVCDFDLEACINFHKEKKADATIVLYAQDEPLEYGLVMTDAEGRIRRFIEKPPWNQVFTNRINTGIYILSPHVLAEIPSEGSYDFGQDLFPKLLEQGARLYGFEPGGYWCDIGSPAAYLQCGLDALEGRVDLDFGMEPSAQGLWSHVPIPSGVCVKAPCYIGKHVTLEPGAVIGPYAIIGESSHVARGATVTRSMVDGAVIGENAWVDGAIVGQGASVRKGTILHEGSVIGAGTVLGDGSVVAAKVRIWPGKELPAYSRVSENLVTGSPRSGLRFSGGNAIRGEAGIVLTPEACFAIGSALGVTGRVGLCDAGDSVSRLAARALACGVSSVGGEVFELDTPFEAAAGYATDLYGLQRTVFVCEQTGKLVLRVYGPRGLPLARAEERKVESALAAGDLKRAVAGQIGTIRTTAGSLAAYTSAAASWGSLGAVPHLAAVVRGTGLANRVLRDALVQMGITLEEHGWEKPIFEAAQNGMSLRAKDEEGHVLETEDLRAILILLELEAGVRTIAVPYGAPMALDHLAAHFDAKLLRLGRDAGAEDLYYRTPYLRDGIFAACRLLGAMAQRGERLHTLHMRAPVFRTARQEVALRGDRASVMQALARTVADASPELVEGLRLPVSDGWVHVSPSAERSVLKIRGEAVHMEAAEEICLDFAERVAALDRMR